MSKKSVDDSSSSNNEDESFKVEEILKHRYVKGKVEYFVKWAGYSSNENTWEPPHSFLDKSVITDYHKRIIKCHEITVRANRVCDEESPTSDVQDEQDSVFDQNDDAGGSHSDEPLMERQKKNKKKKKREEKEPEPAKLNGNDTVELERIVDVREGEDDKLYCMIKVKELADPELVTLETAHKFFPQELIAFYESRMEWVRTKNLAEPNA